MQAGERYGAPLAAAAGLDQRVERDQRLGEIAGISRDAVRAHSEHRMRPIETVECGAARPWRPLVAGRPRRITKICAARALKNVAAERRHIAQLSARREDQALGNDGIVAPHERIVGDVRHPRERAEPQAVGGLLDVLKPFNGADIDQRARLHHVELHQIENGRATGDELRVGGDWRSPAVGGPEGPGDGGLIVRPHIDEWPHHAPLISSRACLMAATMLG